MLPELGPPLHALLEVLAFYVGIRLYFYFKARQPDPLPSRHRTAVLIAAAAGALIGSRVLALLEHPAVLEGLDATGLLVVLYTNKTIVGGLLGGLVAVEATKAMLGERRRSGDLLAYPVLVALIIGRVGCFLAGVSDGTVGVASDLPWALDQGDGIPRHPTALYEIGFLALLGFALRAVEQRRVLREGELFALFLTAYLMWRLGGEFIKPVEPLALGLSAIQWACVLGLLHYARLFAFGRFAPRPVLTT